MSREDLEPVLRGIHEEADNLTKLSMSIWSKPELSFQEVHAHDVVTSALEGYGFAVKRHHILDTAFRAEYSRGKESPVIAVLCEYDALPDIGHGCGHNLIAMAGVAAALGIKAAMEADPTIEGTVVVLGCPAEEKGAGKIDLIEGGAFAGVEAALMVHPMKSNVAYPPMLCVVEMRVKFEGKEAHASGFPWEGRNALDAAVAAYVNIGLLRQQVKPSCRIHGIITKGGTAPNVIPKEAEMVFFLRAPSLRDLNILKERVRSSVDSAAKAHSCKSHLEFDDAKTYLNVISNRRLVSLFQHYGEMLDMDFVDNDHKAAESIPSGSTDMGNVSYVVPSMHPFFRIGEHMNHTKEFTNQSSTDFAHKMAMTAASAMAMTVLALFRSPQLLQEAKDVFLEDLSHNL